jgi:hypothetical protein
MTSEKRKRRRIIGVRLDENEHAALEAFAAAARAESLPAYLRSAGLKQKLAASAAPVISDRAELRRIKIQQNEVAEKLSHLTWVFENTYPSEEMVSLARRVLEETLLTNAQLRLALGYDRQR